MRLFPKRIKINLRFLPHCLSSTGMDFLSSWRCCRCFSGSPLSPLWWRPPIDTAFLLLEVGGLFSSFSPPSRFFFSSFGGILFERGVTSLHFFPLLGAGDSIDVCVFRGNERSGKAPSLFCSFLRWLFSLLAKNGSGGIPPETPLVFGLFDVRGGHFNLFSQAAIERTRVFLF